MKKKVLAFLLASTMVIEPFSVTNAADFSDGMGQDTVQFSDDAEDVPEVENDDEKLMQLFIMNIMKNMVYKKKF